MPSTPPGCRRMCASNAKARNPVCCARRTSIGSTSAIRVRVRCTRLCRWPLERRLPELVILDDGLATYSTIEILTAKRGPLVRPRQKLKASRTVMAAHVADRLRGLATTGRLRWHTALPVSKDLRRAFLKTGGEITRHRFEHLQTLPTGGSHPRDNPVIG